jgi:hypothetical protein
MSMISSTFRCLLDWQLSRLLAFENSAGIDANLTVRVRKTAAIPHENRLPLQTRDTERLQATEWRSANAANSSLLLMKKASVPITRPLTLKSAVAGDVQISVQKRMSASSVRQSIRFTQKAPI